MDPSFVEQLNKGSVEKEMIAVLENERVLSLADLRLLSDDDLKEIGFAKVVQRRQLQSICGVTVPQPQPLPPAATAVVTPPVHSSKRGREDDAPTPLLRESGKWPITYDPTTVFDETKPMLYFLKSGKGEVFSPVGTQRMVRRVEYKKVWDQLTSLRGEQGKSRGLLICGHPGIGKTRLLDLLLCMHLHKYPTTPIIAVGFAYIHIFTNIDGTTPQRHSLSKPVSAQVLEDSLERLGVTPLKEEGEVPKVDILVLHDIKRSDGCRYQNGLMDALLRAFSVTAVVASSPDKANYQNFEHALRADESIYKQCLLPTLDMAQANAFVKHLHPNISEADFGDWFDAVGGVPRHLLSADTVTDVKKEQERVAPNVNYDPTHVATGRETNVIVQMIPTKDGVRFDFVSANACRVWLTTSDNAKPSEIMAKFKAARDDGSRDALGRFFENWFLSVLERKTNLSRVELGKSGAMLEPWLLNSLYPFSVVHFPGDSPDRIVPSTQALLHIPMSPKFPVVDAVITEARASPTAKANATLIQVTVAGGHQPNAAATQTLLNALKPNCVVTDFVWVVDASSKLPTKQSLEGGVALPDYDNIPQWLCRIDDPVCWVRKSVPKGSVSPPAVSFPCSASAPKGDILAEVKKLVDPTVKRFTNYKNCIGTEKIPLHYQT